MSRFGRLAFTGHVRRVQAEEGSERAVARLAEGEGPDPLTDREAAHIARSDGFYLASVGDTGWPYVQHRGGPPGFVHVLDEHVLAFADVGGNRQYVTTGNVRGDDRVALFFMDHAHRTRLKVLGHATVTGPAQDPELAARLDAPRTAGRVERLVSVRVEGLSWNCSHHITPRYTESEIHEVLAPLRARLADLEEENERLRARLAGE
ncbi:pyridoxamine 5'-phosphate oxidase [Streptomyces sulfonofaciens]|uniref:Pyridoxamine 5'-phosphate oxidase n=1 Tax=Streptomyces sulfonofaciens TaxID=68272 RepID=A0A919L051_9ACTN|nr:pyridoxamine 5'-phosphate oxidase family protein [Streptomyces sulfonofaciens]GHH79078.1 pyridoxamine 5'-phosphate oxidase [Streptomyces sulfonofaciens]